MPGSLAFLARFLPDEALLYLCSSGDENVAVPGRKQRAACSLEARHIEGIESNMIKHVNTNQVSVGTSATLVVTGALLVVTRSY